MATAGSLTIGRTAHGILIRVTGRGTAEESPTFERLVTDGLQQACDSIFVDLTDCEYLDSTFLGCLVTMHQRSRSTQSDPLVIVAPPATRTRLFRTVRLDTVLHFVDQGEPLVGPAVHVEVEKAPRTEFGRHVAQTHRALAATGGSEAAKFERIADQIEQELEGTD